MSIFHRFGKTLRAAGFAFGALTALVAATAPANAILVRDDVGLVASQDPLDEWGPVVQLFLGDWTNTFGGGAGAIYFDCTGTLINPRTVITAAHCVNFLSSESYGTFFTGDVSVIVGFGPDTFPGLLNYALTGAPFSQGGAAESTDVIIHPSSELTLGGLDFPYADVALIALDEPIVGVPTMGMYFSPLDALTHVVQAGYGTYGTGDTGEIDIDFIRLVGENQLGLIDSNANFIDHVFPLLAPTRDAPFFFDTQTLYFTDFDDPTRTPLDTANCTFTGDDIICTDLDAVKAIDWFTGDALSREVATAPGDSGGPLIADELAGVPLILGVLSGGWDFFGLGTSLYGDVSFYNPLFAFQQFIIENNPYKYVTALAGDGDWMDPAHWTQTLDPNYYVSDGLGGVVNGVPGVDEDGVYTVDPTIGDVLGTDVTGDPTVYSPLLPPRSSDMLFTGLTRDGDQGGHESPAPVDPGDGPFQVGDELENLTVQQEDLINFGNNLPTSSTLVGPGSTTFVPNNTDGTPGATFVDPAQYFDVTLAAAGTTTLNGAFIEIDMLTLSGGSAGLTIGSTGEMLVNIETDVLLGTLNVNGLLVTPVVYNDFGIVEGNGQIDAFLLENAGGLVSPGNSVGTLTLTTGDYVQDTNGVFLMEVDSSGNDLLEVLDGGADIAGTLIVSRLNNYKPLRGDIETFLTTNTGLTGTFDNFLGSDITPVLQYWELYTPFDASVIALALDYGLFADTPQQQAVADYLDSLTDPDSMPGNDLDPVIEALDHLDTVEELQLALQTLNPTDTFVFDAFSESFNRSIGSILTNRSGVIRNGGGNGGLDVSQLSMARSMLASDDPEPELIVAAAERAVENGDEAGGGMGDEHPWPGAPSVPGDAGVFVAGDFSAGTLDMVGASTDTDGSYIMVGVDKRIGDNTLAGVALNYSDFSADGTLRSFGGNGFAVAGYFSTFDGPFYVNAYASYGWMDFDSERPIIVGPTTLIALGSTDGSALMAGADFGIVWRADDTFSWGPIVQLQYADISIDGYEETGAGPFGAVIADRDLNQALLGVGGQVAIDLSGDESHTTLWGRAVFQSELAGDDQLTQASLVGAPAGGPTFNVLGVDVDQTFFTGTIGITSYITDSMSIQGAYSADISRENVDEHRFSAGVRLGF